MEQLILPEYLLAELVPDSPCPGCAAADRIVRYRFPQIKIGDAHDELLFFGYCVLCGTYVPLHIRVPRLMLGFVLLRAFEQRARLHLGADKFAIIEARNGNALGECTHEYHKLLSQTPIEDGLDSLRAERKAFEMDEQSWGEFMHRMGLGDDTEIPS